jgi:hypothetical protein
LRNRHARARAARDRPPPARPGGLGAGAGGIDVREGAQDEIKLLDAGKEVVGHLDR